MMPLLYFVFPKTKAMINISETNVTIMVSDMDKAIKFYETIGLTLKQRWDNH
jgi:predicted enzyme related to lactoylglutathione lyase